MTLTQDERTYQKKVFIMRPQLQPYRDIHTFSIQHGNEQRIGVTLVAVLASTQFRQIPRMSIRKDKGSLPSPFMFETLWHFTTPDSGVISLTQKKRSVVDLEWGARAVD